jgi:uncharacterized protein (TIGR03437 family)
MKSYAAIGLVWIASIAWAQPQLRQENPVVNGASYSNLIAPGSIFVVFGTNLAGESVVLAPSLPLTTALGGVSIRFTPVGGGAPIDCYMVYTTRNQIAGLLPSSAAPGDYNVTVTYNNQTSAPGRARVVARSIGVVSADSSGAGQAQAQVFPPGSRDWTLNRFTSGRLANFITGVAHPGDRIDLWGTGLGADAASDPTGGTSGDRTAAAAVRVRVGDKEYTPAYAGRASQLPGTDQFVFVLDESAPTGCHVPVQVVAEGTASNVVTLAIAPRGQDACAHPFLSAEQLRRLSEGGTVVLGAFILSRATTAATIPGFGSFEMTTDSVGGEFARYSVGSVGGFGDSSAEYANLIGRCLVFRFRGSEPPPLFRPPVPLDAGNPLRLNGPNANNLAVPRETQSNVYGATLYQSGIPGIPGSGSGSPVIAQGNYTLSGPGGADIGPFQATIAVPAPFTWTNRDGINDVSRGQGLALTWSGGAGVMVISGSSTTRVGGTANDPVFDGAVFVCFQNASAGNFTVPASILSQLPASGDLATGTGSGSLALQQSGPLDGGTFTAPLTAGGNIERGQFLYSLISSKTVNYR